MSAPLHGGAREREHHRDSFHKVGNGKGPGDEDGARGPGKALYLLDPNRQLIEIRYYE